MSTSYVFPPPEPPSVEIEGPCSSSCSSFGRGCQIERKALGAPRSRKPACGALQTQSQADAPNIETRPACTSAGSSSIGLGGEPRGPNHVLSSHNAVILASATTGPRVGPAFSASSERLPKPNSVSANRRSISCCTHAMASSAVAQGETALADWPKLALTVIRLGACTTAGALTANVARPWRNRRRGTISELIYRSPHAVCR